MEPDNNSVNRLELTTRARLARLASVPVDASTVNRKVCAAMAEHAARRPKVLRFWWPISGAAAAVAMVAVAIVLSGASPVVANTNDLAKLHRQVVAGQTAATVVHSLDEANAILQRGGADLPPMDHAGSGHEGMSCCEGKLCGRRVATLVLQIDNAMVSITVARRSDMKCRGDATVKHNGDAYVVGQAEGLNMVMEERGERWLCLVGDLPNERLMELIEEIKF